MSLIKDSEVLSDIIDKMDKIGENYHELDKKLSVSTAMLQNHLDNYHEDIPNIATALKSIDSRLGEYNVQLALHIQGVQTAQEGNRLLKDEIDAYKKEIEHRLEHAEAPLAFISSTKKVSKWIMVVLGAAAAVASAFKWLIRS